MKRPTYDTWTVSRYVFAVLATVDLSGLCAFAQLQVPITTARQAHHLPIDQARHGYPVRLHAVVTYYDPFFDTRFATMFVKDSTDSIFVSAPPGPRPPIWPGSIVDLEAVTSPGGFAPMLELRKMNVVGHTSLPRDGKPISFPRLRSGALRVVDKELELACEVGSGIPQMLVGDPTRLRQILNNLIGNALKFTENGEIVVKVDLENCEDDTLPLHFTVRDTGIGIPADKLLKIFEAFSQADGSTTRRYGGTGLGLTVSQRLVKMMGGRMWVESEPGHGSCFHFTARMGVSRLVRSSQPVWPHIPDDAQFLVVDDNETNRRILRDVLVKYGVDVMVADSANNALALMRERAGVGRPITLLVTDAHMPDVDGFSLAKQVKCDPTLAGAAIMMLTSAGHRGDGARCRELGISAYLTKPVSQSELREVVFLLLNREAAEFPATGLITRHAIHEIRMGSSLKILVAEDNLVNQRLAVRMLEKRGHNITLASNGRDAVAALEAAAFDLVLMDIQMPEMDGFEATAAIREGEQGTARHQPIVAMTAHAMKGDEQRCLDAGMDGYLAKPIRSEELYALLDGFPANLLRAKSPAREPDKTLDLQPTG